MGNNLKKWLLNSFQNSHPRLNLHNFSKSVSWIGYYSDCNQCCDWWIYGEYLRWLAHIINVMIGGFSGEDLGWLAHVTFRLQLCRLIRAKYKS